jgi:hypothetical protein
MFKHSSLLDRSRASVSQLALKRRIHRLKANLNSHLDQLEEVEHEYSQLPRCLRDEHLVDAIDHAVDNGVALLARTEAWKFEDGEVVEEKVVQDSEEYLKRCVAVMDDIGEAVRALRALVAEEEEEDDEEHEAEVEEDKENGEEEGV